jgi:hypothetical protein
MGRGRPQTLRHRLDGGDVDGVVDQRQLVKCGVPALDVEQRHEQVRVVAQRRRNRAQPADVLRVLPAGIVSAAVGVGDERDCQTVSS